MLKNTQRLPGFSKIITTKMIAGMAATGLLLSAQALAHHPIGAKFDADQPISIEGHVTKVDWRNPHAHLFINVEDEDGTITNWAVELESPVLLRASGWHKDSVQAGDLLTVEGGQARDGSRQLWGELVANNENPEQALFTINDELPPVDEEKAAPRWPDGHPALGAVPGGSGGYWRYPSEPSLHEEGTEIEFDRFGLLMDLDDAEQVAPFQPWALGLYKLRQERSLSDDPVYLNCKPPGGPRQFQSALGFELIEDLDKERVFVLHGGGNSNYRILYLDERDPVGQVGGDDNNPLFFGRSIGAWDGDTLVVETSGFNEDFWFSNGGLPHTDLLTMEERFTRVNYDTLLYEVTIDDPGAYTRPWTASWTLRWMEGQEKPQHFCQNNRM